MRIRSTILLIIATLCIASDLRAQDLSETFSTYKSKYVATRLHLVFNQPSYAPGDTAYFSALYLNEASKPVKGAQTAVLEIVAPDGRSIQAINFKLQDGRGVNQVAIPSDAAGGSYRFYAYTNWMRNFGSEWFFKKNIIIYDHEGMTPSPAPVLAAYPEGGSLVAELENSMLVTGRPDTRVVISDETGSQTTDVVLDGTGMGRVFFTPKATSASGTYVVQRADGAKTAIGRAVESGAVLRFDGTSKVAVITTADLGNKNLLAVFTSAGKIEEIKRFTPSSGSYELTVPQNNTGSLFCQLYILDSDGRMIAHRVLSRPDASLITPKADIPSEATQRQKVQLNIAAAAQADLAVSVYRKDLFKTRPVKQAFYFSELPEVYEWSERTTDYETRLNDFLISQKWSRIDWTRITSGEKNLQYPFNSQVILRGSVVSRTNGEPVPDSTNVIAYLQKNTMGYDSYTRDGKFTLPFIFDFWEKDYIFFHLARKYRDLDGEYKVVLDNDSIKWASIQVDPPVKQTNPYIQYLGNNKLIANSYSFFAKEKKTNTAHQNPNASFEDEIVVIDFQVNVQEFVVFPAMEDLIREVVPFLVYRKSGSHAGVHVLFKLDKTNRLAKGNPLYIVDGVLTKNSNFFLKLKPKDLLTIKVANDLNRLQQMGKIGDNGMVFVESRVGNLADSLKKANDIPVTGLSRTAAIKYMEHNQASSWRVPDLRPNTYWMPSVKPAADIFFYASDDVAPLTILVQGMTSDGVPIFLEHEVNVKFRRSP